MKKIFLTICCFILALVFTGVQAQSQEEMKKWSEYMTLSPTHKMMATWNGEWVSEITMWMAPGAPPTKSTGNCSNRMELGGRYQVGTYSGTYSGMPFNGMSLLAYDNHKKVFESIWIDNMGSGIMHLQGPWDEATKTMTLKGRMVDPTTGKEVDVKETFKIVDPDTQVMEMYMPMPDGKDFKTMEMTFRRKK